MKYLKKAITIMVPRKLIVRVGPHPEDEEGAIVFLENGMYTDVFVYDDGFLYTITNDKDLVDYLKKNTTQEKVVFMHDNNSDLLNTWLKNQKEIFRFNEEKHVLDRQKGTDIMLIEELKKSLVFNMSLASKELFHSNVWVWLMEIDNDIFNKVFFEIECSQKLVIKREQSNRDITVYDGDKAYVIENKIKSIPTYKQLKEYEDDIIHHFKKGILTGIAEPIFKLPDGWDFLSYSTIADRIKLTTKDNTKFSTLEQAYIDDYCKMIKQISEITKQHLSDSYNTFNYCCEGLEEIRFDDVYKKLKASDFVSYFNHNCAYAIENGSNYKYGWNIDFNNKSATIDLYLSKDNDNSIKVQIQGLQYRRGVHKVYKMDADDLFNEYVQYDWFDGTFDKKVNRKIFGHTTKMKPRGNKQYDTYSGEKSNYRFLYQYYDLEPMISYAELAKKIIDDLNKASQIIIKHNL